MIGAMPVHPVFGDVHMTNNHVVVYLCWLVEASRHVFCVKGVYP
jgi:hypothetical protein